jgi:hypothetical protein
MAAQSPWKHVPHGVLVFVVSIMSGSKPMAAADLPTSPGVGFAMVGIAPGQTARVTALNVGPGGPVLPSGAAPGSCGGGVTFEFYGAAGELLKKKGQCCNLERAGTVRARYGTSSPRNLEQSCNEIEAALNLTDPYSSCLPLSNCVHCFVSLGSSARLP